MASCRRNRCSRTTSTRRTRRKPFSARLPEERAPSPRDFFNTLRMCGKKCCRSEPITKENERGKGIGKKLPGYFIEETAKSAGCRAIILEPCIPRTSATASTRAAASKKASPSPSKLFKNNRKAASPNRRLTTTAPAPRARPSFFPHFFLKFHHKNRYAPMNACSNKTELRTRKRSASANFRHGRYAHPRVPANACSHQAELRTQKNLQAPTQNAKMNRRRFS